MIKLHPIIPQMNMDEIGAHAKYSAPETNLEQLPTPANQRQPKGLARTACKLLTLLQTLSCTTSLVENRYLIFR